MARAKDVKPGQVWTAKVSGKTVKVQVDAEIQPTARGRRRFQWKNLSTGRMAKGTAAKLRKLIHEAPATGGTPVTPPTPAVPRSSKRPAQRVSNPVRAQEYCLACHARPAAPTSTLCHVCHAKFEAEEAAAAHEAELAERAMYARQDVYDNAPPPELGSLRGAMGNPTHYPSRVARRAAEAISRSSAQTVEEVVAVIREWARSSRRGSRAAAPAGYTGVAPMYNHPPMTNGQAFYGARW